MNGNRRFFVIEGTDGSGKSEQFKRLVARLQANGYKTATVDFPRYSEPSAHFVKSYLNGEYGTAAEVSPRKASLFYAMDRFGAGLAMNKALQRGEILVANRYVASNMGHQGGKIDDPKKRRLFFRWLYEIEYLILEIPKPDLNIVLHVPAKIAQKLVDGKDEKAREYAQGKKRDIHEADLNHLKRAEEVYLEITRLFPRDFQLVECVEGGRLLSIDEIHEKVWALIAKAL